MNRITSNHGCCSLDFGVVIACSVVLLTPAWLYADFESHAEDDRFAAEVASLLPAVPPPPAPPPPLPTQRIVLGDWSGIIRWTPHIPVSVATLPDGRILSFASNERTTFPDGPEFTYAATWDPATGQFEEYNHPSHDMFCGGLVLLPDGRLLVNGGRSVTVLSSFFDWRSNTWTPLTDMNDRRWYNTTVALPSGQAFTASGSGGSGTTELWDESVGWSRLPGIDWNIVLREPGYINIWHPFLVLAPSGRLFHFGPTRTMHWIDSDGGGTLTSAGARVPGTLYPKEGVWAMYDEGKILVAGGGVNTTQNPNDTTTGTSSSSSFTIDLDTDPPTVASNASMSFPRQFANSVLVPNGEVIVFGGNTSGRKFNDTGSILTPEIWNPTTRRWRPAADASVPRNYHSFALLLPDGRILSGGGGLAGNSADHRDAQIYTPPNLFNPDGSLASRPRLDTAPLKIGVATTFTVSGTPGMKKFSFIKLSAMTHSVNTDLRYLPLPFVESSPGVYHLTARSNLNVMTPGYWMLFGLDSAGVHSVSKIVQVDPNPAVHIASLGDQTSSAGRAINLQLVGSGPEGSTLTWAAVGLPSGLSLNPSTGLITGVPAVTASARVTITLTDGNTTDTAVFRWVVDPFHLHRQFADFSDATGLTLNGKAAILGSVLQLATNAALQAGSAYLSSAIPMGADTSFTTRWVFRIHGSADGADGLAFVVQGNGPDALGGTGGNLAYRGVERSVAVEVDNHQGSGDPNGNHLGILLNGVTTNHVATWTPGWDLENEQSHTLWVAYDGPARRLEVYLAEGVVSERPSTSVMTVEVDLPATVGEQAWFGFAGATGRLTNHHDIESWSLTVNTLAPPSQPILMPPSSPVTVVGAPFVLQMQASDVNGDPLQWSAADLPPGFTIHPVSGLISGAATASGRYTPIISVSDGNTPAVRVELAWEVKPTLTLNPLAGPAIRVNTAASLTARANGGLNVKYKWGFGDGTPDSTFSDSPSVSHTFSTPGRFLVVVTARDDTGRQVTASFRQGVFGSPTAGRPVASASLLYEEQTGVSPRLWVVNPDNDSVSIFDVPTRTRLAEVPVGREPRAIALGPERRVWVVNSESATISVLRSDFSLVRTLELPAGSRPFGLVIDPAGTRAYVALESGGQILQLRPSTGEVLASAKVGLHVRHLSLSAGATRLLATRFITPPQPGEQTATPQSRVGGVSFGGQMLVLQPSSLAILATNILHHSERPDTSNSARGVPNFLGAAAISPDGLSAWIPSKQDNILRGMLRSRTPLTHDMTLRSIVSRVVIGTGVEDLAGRVDFDNAGMASAAVFDPTGLLLFVALEGSREIAVVDAWSKREILRFPAGRAPQGVVVSPDGSTLFAHNFMDRTITVHDVAALQNGAEQPPPAPVILECVGEEKLPLAVLRGKQLFYDARDARLAFQQYMSCASCHNEGGQDGRTWDFTQFGEGLRNTIVLRGHGGTAQGPLHWTGNFDEVQDFEGQIRGFALGRGLMADADFHGGTRSQSMGDRKAGLSADLDALAAYLESLTSYGTSPERNSGGSLSAAGIAGQIVFQREGCATCHAGSQMTDSAIGVAHDVGTLRPSSGGRLGSPLAGLDTPTLRGLWSTPPYLHDGSAATLADAVMAHRGVSLSPTDLGNLTAYLRQLDDHQEFRPTLRLESDGTSVLSLRIDLPQADFNSWTLEMSSDLLNWSRVTYPVEGEPVILSEPGGVQVRISKLSGDSKAFFRLRTASKP